VHNRQPSDGDIEGLIFAHIEEEALMREAERLGLGKDDTIIRRRLAQKMRFIIQDVDGPAPINKAELSKWFERNIDKFILPETRSFSHIFISPETHDGRLDEHAQALLDRVEQTNGQIDAWKAIGDPFIMNRQFKNLSATDVNRLFGEGFTKGIFNANGSDWQGPIKSAFGLHLVRIDGVTSKTTPSLEDISPQVEQAWQEEAVSTANADRLKALIGKYKIDIQDIHEPQEIQE